MSFITQEKFVAFFKMRKKASSVLVHSGTGVYLALHPFCGSAGWD